MKKTIAFATILASSTTLAKNNTAEDVIKKLTGPNQAESGQLHEMCLKVTPYFLGSLPPNAAVKFHSLAISGSGAWQAEEQGECAEPNYETKKCEEGFVKVTSTAPIACNVPVAL